MSNTQSNKQATALVIDMRNFTPNLLHPNISRSPQSGYKDPFYEFIADFYKCCLTACSGVSCHNNKLLYLNSTGDGMLCVFRFPKWHFIQAYLAGIILTKTLDCICVKYNKIKCKSIPDVSFGLGIESGDVQHVTANKDNLSIKTYVGECINIASRLESLNKSYARTNLLIAQHTNDLLCKHFFKGIKYTDLMKEALGASLTESRRKALWKIMRDLNDRLLVTFMGPIYLKGISDSIAVVRLSPTLAKPERDDFKIILRKCKRILSFNNEQYKKIKKLLGAKY